VEFRKGPNIQLEKSSEAPKELLQRLSLEGCQHAYIDGGKVIQSFISNNLIDSLTITTVPVLIGKGRSLFGSLLNDLKLKVARSKAYEFGFIQTTYSTRTDAYASTFGADGYRGDCHPVNPT
jgi:dihydrofolate reductase